MIEKAKEYIMNTYNRFPIVFEKGDGMYLYDTNGKKYLDFVAGIAVNSLGHNHKELTEAIANQASNLIHCSNLYWTKPQVDLAEKLVKNSCFDKVFFCNSGAEAIEAALKLSRKYGKQNGEDRYKIITMINSFHGRTYGAVSATGQEKYQKSFYPLVPGITHVPFNDIKSIEKAVNDKTVAILIEPIQGEGGILPAEKEYLIKLRELCDKKDILLMFDEIQCGVGRTGFLFAYDYYGVEPDICVIAKGIAGGVPCGVMLANKKTGTTLIPGDHASTFGGNPLATAVANVVIDNLTTKGLLQNVKKQSQYLLNGLNKLKEKYETILNIRGVGLMLGIELSIPTSEIVNKCIENGLLLVGAGNNVIRFVPALIVENSHIDEALDILDKALS